jgi:hypothetical protein
MHLQWPTQRGGPLKGRLAEGRLYERISVLESWQVPRWSATLLWVETPPRYKHVTGSPTGIESSKLHSISRHTRSSESIVSIGLKV